MANGGPATPDSSNMPATSTSPATESTDMPVVYDPKTNTIVLRKGAPIALPAIAPLLAQPDLLRELAPGDWLLSANLRIERGAVLEIAAPEVRRLKLRSDAEAFVWIKTLGGQLTFRETCVTSWDTARNDVDENYEDGRSFVLARDGARMEIQGAELSYLGYDANESYGVAWRLRDTVGSAADSRFGYNFYGLYSYEVDNLTIRDSEVHHSILYGIDPHTRSDKLLIEGNVSHHNGKHGIILAEKCSDGVVRGNTVYNNTMHGIVIYQGSDDNLVEGNTVYANGQQGINVNDSSGNIVRGNTVSGNTEAGIGVGQDADNTQVIGNHVRENRTDGIYIYSNASDTVLSENTIAGNLRYGIYVKSEDNRIADGNQVFGNSVGIYLNVKEAPEISRESNQIYDNLEEDVRRSG
jgi:parallel beta-helix repeat protein